MQRLEFGSGIHAIAGFGEPGKPFRQCIRELASAGYAHFMLMGWEPNAGVGADGDAPQAFINFFESDRAALLKTVAGHGMRISSIYPGFGLFNLRDPQETIDKLLRYRDFAWSIGVRQMIHPTGAAKQPTAPLDEDKRRDIRTVAQIMDAVASDAPGQVFRMAIDIHYNATLETIADCEYFMDCTSNPAAGFCLNMGHQTTSNQPGWELLERYPERIQVMAWKDHLVPGEPDKPVVSVELGKGHTPFKRYIEVWRRVPTQALQMITMEDVPHEERLEILNRSRIYLEKLITE